MLLPGLSLIIFAEYLVVVGLGPGIGGNIALLSIIIKKTISGTCTISSYWDTSYLFDNRG